MTGGITGRQTGRAGAFSRSVAGDARASGDNGAKTLPVGEFFVCDILAAMPKHDLASMEHPLFSLATRPDRRILSYEHNGSEITVTPSVKGRATIFDADILIFCISQLMAAINAGRPTARALTLTAHDLLLATGRDTSGDAYRRLRDAFERLAGTRITTNIATGGQDVTRGFGLIESWEIVRHTRRGRMVSVRVTLSDWLYQAVLSKSVLTLNRAYFGLRKPLERRLYELARKHCGRQPEWRVSVETLCKKSGSASPRRVFRAMLREIIRADTLPDYLMLEAGGDIIRVTPREGVVDVSDAPVFPPQISPDALEAARRQVPGADVYALEAEWRGVWAKSGQPVLHAPDRAFLGWIAKRAAADATERLV
jgi:plasmid replication initiation protein